MYPEALPSLAEYQDKPNSLSDIPDNQDGEMDKTAKTETSWGNDDPDDPNGHHDSWGNKPAYAGSKEPAPPPERGGIVHRIDHGTTGLLAIAKSPRACKALSRQFRFRKAGRKYLALVLGQPGQNQGIICQPIRRHPDHRTRMQVGRSTSARESETRYRVVQRLGAFSELELSLETGRTHQIRVHLLHLGLPVLGDTTYKLRGRQQGEKLARTIIGAQALHAHELYLMHPASGVPMRFCADPPADYQRLRYLLSKAPTDTEM